MPDLTLNGTGGPVTVPTVTDADLRRDKNITVRPVFGTAGVEFSRGIIEPLRGFFVFLFPSLSDALTVEEFLAGTNNFTITGSSGQLSTLASGFSTFTPLNTQIAPTGRDGTLWTVRVEVVAQ